MNEYHRDAVVRKTYTSSWAAFYLYYVAMAICIFGPHLNPDFAARIFLTPTVGFVLGLLLLGGVVYLKYGQCYERGPEGVKIIWRYPPKEHLIRWSEIDTITVRAGLTQTLLRIGTVVIQPRQGEEMVWYGLESAKQVKTFLERNLDESAAQ
jgi:hypothetical protein